MTKHIWTDEERVDFLREERKQPSGIHFEEATRNLLAVFQPKWPWLTSDSCASRLAEFRRDGELLHIGVRPYRRRGGARPQNMDIFSADDKKVTYTAPEGDDWPELSAHYKDMKKRGVKMLVDAHSNTITIEHPPKLIELLAVWMEES